MGKVWKRLWNRKRVAAKAAKLAEEVAPKAAKVEEKAPEPAPEPEVREEVVVKKEGSDTNADACEDKKCPVTEETCNESCSEGECVKEESSKDEELVPPENVD